MEINRIKSKLLIKYPSFGSVIAKINYIENTEISVVCTWDLCPHVQTIHYVQILLTYLGLGRLQATGT